MCNSCTTTARKRCERGTCRAKVAYNISFPGSHSDLILSSHAETKMHSTSFLRKYTGILLMKKESKMGPEETGLGPESI